MSYYQMIGTALEITFFRTIYYNKGKTTYLEIRAWIRNSKNMSKNVLN